MNVHTTSRGFDPTRLVGGQDLVIELDPAHGLDLPSGVLAHDHLTLEARFALDAIAGEALARWRDEHDDALTFDGVCLPEIWTFKLYEAVNRCLVAALGLRAAVETYEPGRLWLADAGRQTELAARAAGRGLPVVAPAFRPLPAPEHGPRAPVGRRARATAIRAATWWGAPSLLRPSSTLLLSYWPLAALLDRMLSDGRWRPAVALEKRPAGARRSVRAAGQGGWLGLPSRSAVAGAQERLSGALAALPAPAIDVDGLAAGPLVHDALTRTLTPAGEILAALPLVRRALAGGRIERVIGTYELDPYARLVLWLARETGVPTLCLAHGAYLLPQPVADLELADEVALWSPAIAPPISNHDRPIHVVGYPRPHARVATRRFGVERAPRVVVLAQTTAPSTAAVDARIVMRHYAEAVAAIAERLPGARVVLRPHPSQGPPALAVLELRFPRVDIVVDRCRDVRRCLAAADVAIGAASVATFECALVGTPVIVLNVTGFDWRWPLGDGTSVPVARCGSELAMWLERWRREGTLPGADDLLDGLGAHGGDASERLIGALERRPVEPAGLS